MQRQPIVVIEATLDDLNPEVYEYVIERLFECGARDVFLQPVIMKKSRPGTTLTVLCEAPQVETLAALILTETTTLGVRWRTEERFVAERRTESVSLRGGRVRVKLAEVDGRVINAAPEYEDCKLLARSSGRPLKLILDEARSTAWRRFGAESQA
ncbi:MAG: DUF111 family protein [Candidatus Tectomicrobia bacterium]|nr:DUF111 family protein [Candidatus Tectomicrobia bacterium]